MTLDFLPSKFPANDVTDGQYLYRSLGSFWTQIFQDKNVLKGYTTGMAEELIQAYINLVETVNQYSVTDIDVLHTERWKPLVIKKSEYNKAPFVFEPNAAKFGVQPASDKYYANALFRFGFPKETSGDIYSFSPGFALQDFGLIANRIISPSLLLIPGVDTVIANGVVYCNTDLFNNQYVPRAKVLGEFGQVATYAATDGTTQEDEFIVLWIYQAAIDNDELYRNFGALFDLRLPTSSNYKELLKSLMGLCVSGPTITAITAALAALLASPVCIDSQETVEDVYSDDTREYVVTDKNVYRIPVGKQVAANVVEEAVLYAGQALTTNIVVLDTVLSNAWWETVAHNPKTAMASHVFACNPHMQLFFSTGVEMVTHIDGVLNFPVTGDAKDVEAFQAYINEPERKAELLPKLGLSVVQAVPINPSDFVFRNLFKNNTLLLKLSFDSDVDVAQFFSLLPILKDYLPPHVYIIIYVTLTLPAEDILNLNNGLTIPAFGSTRFSLDGSAQVSGARPVLGSLETDLLYYKDYENRVFCISVGPYREGEPLHADANLDKVYINGTTGNRIIAGHVFTDIPLTVQPIGEETARTPSTKEIPTVLLIDFS